VEAQPALTRTPEAYAAAIRQAGAGAVGEAVRELNEAKRKTAETGQQLAGMIGAARSQQAQRDKVFWTGLAAFVVALLLGLFGSPYLARELPFGWSNRVAAIVMDADPWRAGIALMQAAHPNRWDNLVTPYNLINGNPANAKAVAGCQAEAVKAHKPQMCGIIVRAP
jgi:hypothetical protein